MTVALRKVRRCGKIRHYERSGDEQGLGNLSGDGAPKATCKRTVEHGRLVASAVEKTVLFSTNSFAIEWEFLVTQKKTKIGKSLMRFPAALEPATRPLIIRLRHSG
jgi:hypothetical protein